MMAHPINVNTAPLDVLRACFTGLGLAENAGSGHAITRAKAHELALFLKMRGVLRNAGGAPITNARITLASGTAKVEARTDFSGRFQLELRRQVIESGRFYIVSTQIDGVGALRVTIINPLTTAEHLDELLETIRSCGRDRTKA